MGLWWMVDEKKDRKIPRDAAGLRKKEWTVTRGEICRRHSKTMYICSCCEAECKTTLPTKQSSLNTRTTHYSRIMFSSSLVASCNNFVCGVRHTSRDRSWDRAVDGVVACVPSQTKPISDSNGHAVPRLIQIMHMLCTQLERAWL